MIGTFTLIFPMRSCFFRLQKRINRVLRGQSSTLFGSVCVSYFSSAFVCIFPRGRFISFRSASPSPLSVSATYITTTRLTQRNWTPHRPARCNPPYRSTAPPEDRLHEKPRRREYKILRASRRSGRAAARSDRCSQGARASGGRGGASEASAGGAAADPGPAAA